MCIEPPFAGARRLYRTTRPSSRSDRRPSPGSGHAHDASRSHSRHRVTPHRRRRNGLLADVQMPCAAERALQDQVREALFERPDQHHRRVEAQGLFGATVFRWCPCCALRSKRPLPMLRLDCPAGRDVTRTRNDWSVPRTGGLTVPFDIAAGLSRSGRSDCTRDEARARAKRPGEPGPAGAAGSAPQRLREGLAGRQVDGDELIDHDGRTILASGAQFSSEVDGAIIDADGGRLIFRPARKTLGPATAA